MIKYQAKIQKDGTDYSVIFPDLPGCVSMGSTLEEAKEMAAEALSLYLEEARDPKWKVPEAKSRRGNSYYWIEPHPNVAIAMMIRRARLGHGLTQVQMAARMGVRTQQFQKLETPGKSNPTVMTLAAISKALDGSLEIQLTS